MKLEVPNDHKVGLRVPHGGSNCAKCKYVSDDEKDCSNDYFVKWNGSNTLPAPAASYCCDFFLESKRSKTLGDQLKRQRATK